LPIDSGVVIYLLYKTENVQNVAPRKKVISRSNGLSIATNGEVIVIAPATMVVKNMAAPEKR
jgi:hypothetical protein